MLKSPSAGQSLIQLFLVTVLLNSKDLPSAKVSTKHLFFRERVTEMFPHCQVIFVDDTE